MARAKRTLLARAGDSFCVPIPLDTKRYKELEARERQKAQKALRFLMVSLLVVFAGFFALVEFALPALRDSSGKITVVLIFFRIIIWFCFRV